MAKLNRVLGQSFSCPLCERQHELQANKRNKPFFFCSKFGATVNVQSQPDVFIEEHAAEALAAAADGGTDTDPGETPPEAEDGDTTETEPWRA